MAVGAYASVLALMRALDNALLPSRSPLLPNISQIQTLQQKVALLQESLELLPSLDTPGDDSTIRQIRQLVRQADDFLDKYVVDQLRGGESEDKSLSPSFCQEIQVLIQWIESVHQDSMNKMIMMDKDRGSVLQPRKVGTSRVESRDNDTTVGFENLLFQIMDKLTDRQRHLQIIPILGVGGSGKTTLAKHIFDHPYVKDYFDVLLWHTMSQEYDVREILLGLIRGLSRGVVVGDSGDYLYKALFGRRYLIVIDDVWSIKAWDDLRKFLPDNGNGSRILITTRLSNVASSLGTTYSYNIELLDEAHSWDLFCRKVFGYNSCPIELEEISKKIARRCNGLPLAILVAASSVSEFGMDRKLWEAFAEKMDSSLDLDSNENLTRILSLSYNSLPIHLKLCLISMEEFHKNSRIEVSRLVELWVAVGIVKPVRYVNTEEVAMQYVDEFVARNLITVVERGSRGNIKTCGINDAVRQLCTIESHGEGFLGVPRVQEISYLSLKSKNTCFLCGKNGKSDRTRSLEVLVGSLSTTLTNPMVCDACDAKYPQLDGSRFVRLIEKVHDQHVEIPQMTKLRSLSIGDRFRFNSKQIVFASPSMISLLWNLQRLYFHVSGHEGSMLLSKLWEMPQLRYVHLLRHMLPDPVDANALIVLQHLRALTLVKNLRFTAKVVGRIPNLVRLSVLYDPDPKEGEELNCSYYCLDNLALLENLQSLKLACRRRSFDIKDISMEISLKIISFPRSLEKLTLMDCKLVWEDMSVLGSLPKLEVLKLNRDAFVGDKWCTGEGEFQKLRYLKLEDLNLVSWTADSNAFPELAKLVLVGLCQLEEIPSLLGDLPYIETIQANYCTQYVVNSVNEIREEQELSWGNVGLRCIFDED